MADAAPSFHGLHMFVRDMPATLAFYRHLGLTFAPEAESEVHNRIALPNGTILAFGTYALTRGYDPRFREPAGGPTNTLQFDLESRAAVDAIYAELTAAGYAGHIPPWDAFWGSRYAEVEDPDGNIVGFHSPVDPALRSATPI